MTTAATAWSSQARAFIGNARVLIRNLRPENSWRHSGGKELDLKNVERLIELFTLDKCRPFEDANHIPVLLSDTVLQRVLAQNNLTIGQLRDEPPPAIDLDDDAPLTYLRGRHRLAAAEHFLGANDRWLVKLYRSHDLPKNVCRDMRDHNDNSQKDSDGLIILNYLQWKKQGNEEQANRWLAKWSGNPSKLRDFHQLQNNEALRHLKRGFHRNLPYLGLWKKVKSGTFHRVLTMKCPEELTHYLHHDADVWHSIVKEHARYLDPHTVELLQGRSPFYSTTDRQFVLDSFKSGELFSCISDPRVRIQLQESVCRVRSVIPSLYCFLEDTKFLEPASKVMRRLLPPKFKGTIQEGLFKCYVHPRDRRVWIQRDEDRYFRKDNISAEVGFWSASRQLWLYALRAYPDMGAVKPRISKIPVTRHGTRSAAECWSRLALLATRVGFVSKEIRKILQVDMDDAVAKDTLTYARPVETFGADKHDLENGIQRVKAAIHLIEPYPVEERRAVLTSDGAEPWRLELRCGRMYEQDFYNDRCSYFLKQIYERPRRESPKSNITSFTVARDIFHAFFGGPLQEDDILGTFGEAEAGLPDSQAVSPSEYSQSEIQVDDTRHTSPMMLSATPSEFSGMQADDTRHTSPMMLSGSPSEFSEMQADDTRHTPPRSSTALSMESLQAEVQVDEVRHTSRSLVADIEALDGNVLWGIGGPISLPPSNNASPRWPTSPDNHRRFSPNIDNGCALTDANSRATIFPGGGNKARPHQAFSIRPTASPVRSVIEAAPVVSGNPLLSITLAGSAIIPRSSLDPSPNFCADEVPEVNTSVPVLSQAAAVAMPGDTMVSVRNVAQLPAPSRKTIFPGGLRLRTLSLDLPEAYPLAVSNTLDLDLPMLEVPISPDVPGNSLVSGNTIVRNIAQPPPAPLRETMFPGVLRLRTLSSDLQKTNPLIESTTSDLDLPMLEVPISTDVPENSLVSSNTMVRNIAQPPPATLRKTVFPGGLRLRTLSMDLLEATPLAVSNILDLDLPMLEVPISQDVPENSLAQARTTMFPGLPLPGSMISAATSRHAPSSPAWPKLSSSSKPSTSSSQISSSRPHSQGEKGGKGRDQKVQTTAHGSLSVAARVAMFEASPPAIRNTLMPEARLPATTMEEPAQPSSMEDAPAVSQRLTLWPIAQHLGAVDAAQHFQDEDMLLQAEPELFHDMPQEGSSLVGAGSDLPKDMTDDPSLPTATSQTPPQADGGPVVEQTSAPATDRDLSTYFFNSNFYNPNRKRAHGVDQLPENPHFTFQSDLKEPSRVRALYHVPVGVLLQHYGVYRQQEGRRKIPWLLILLHGRDYECVFFNNRTDQRTCADLANLLRHPALSYFRPCQKDQQYKLLQDRSVGRLVSCMSRGTPVIVHNNSEGDFKSKIDYDQHGRGIRSSLAIPIWNDRDLIWEVYHPTNSPHVQGPDSESEVSRKRIHELNSDTHI